MPDSHFVRRILYYDRMVFPKYIDVKNVQISWFSDILRQVRLLYRIQDDLREHLIQQDL